MTTFNEVSAALQEKRLAQCKAEACRIADKCVPRYRNGRTSYSCYSTTAQLWQAAWDGAIEAMDYDSDQFKISATLQDS